MATMAADVESHTINPLIAWRAVERRDARYDGQFVYAVASTRIYCKPSCPSRRPSRANVRFFVAADDAESAGYRACLRCKPRADSGESSIAKAVEAAREYLDAHVDRTVSLDELARHAGVSSSHLQRSFRKIVGLSPRQYHDARRVRQLKSRLRAGDTVSRATYEAGYSSSSRVYERADKVLGMTPAAFRRGGTGVRITYAVADAPLGRVLVATTDRGVCAVEIGTTNEEVESALRADFPNAEIVRDDDANRAWVKAVLNRIRHSDARDADVPLDAQGTAFQLKVWDALRTIPAGERRSYSEVAESIGKPSAARSVARACATNRIAVLIPCHRVVRGSGELAGYKWGVERKKRLLEAEAAERSRK